MLNNWVAAIMICFGYLAEAYWQSKLIDDLIKSLEAERSSGVIRVR